MHSPWQRILIGGIPAEVLDPGAGALPHALLLLHDEPAAPVATNSRLTRELLARRLRCVAPLATDSWWLDRVSPRFHPEKSAEQHLLDTVIPWMESDAGFGCQGFAVAGIGIGGQGALRLGFRHPDRVPVVASIAGALDFHELYGRGTVLDELFPSREHARQQTAILHVSGHDWPRHIWFACAVGNEWHRGNDRLHEKLAAIGVPHVADLDRSDPPEAYLGSMLDFIVTALERDSRRLA